MQGHPYHNGGASTTQELAFALATAVDYLRAMQAHGLSIDDTAPRIRFSLSIGSNFFMEIARPGRKGGCGPRRSSRHSGRHNVMRVHAWTSVETRRYATLTSTCYAVTHREAFSRRWSMVDDSVHFALDELVRVLDEFSRRIARNTHAVLREESNLARTSSIQPAAPGMAETLTDAVARQTWAIFQEVEKQGGMGEIFSGCRSRPQVVVAATAAQRAANLAKRKDIFVGTNMYPNPKETRLEVLEMSAIKAERTEALIACRAAADTSKSRRLWRNWPRVAVRWIPQFRRRWRGLPSARLLRLH